MPRGRGPLCVNCNLGVNNINTTRRFRIMELDPRVCALLCKWVHPMIVTDKHLVCQACWQLAAIGVNLSLQQDEPRVELYHVEQTTTDPVCLLCGRTLKWQSEVILKENPTELQQLIIKTIENKVGPQQITPSDRVCHPCWLLTQREVCRHNPIDPVRSSEETQQHEDQQLISEEDSNQYVIETQIILRDFRRARNTAQCCVFSECSNTTRLRRVSDEVRVMMLQRHNLYIPSAARVCYEHLSIGCWDNFNHEFIKSVNTFNANQVEHAFSLVKAYE